MSINIAINHTVSIRSSIRLLFFMLAAIVSIGLYCSVPTTSHAAVTPDDPGNFITTWNTENAGTSNDNEITIPGIGGGYNYEIYWEDTASSTINGTTTLITTNSYTLTFPAPGIYEVQASGTFPQIRFNNSGDKDKILTVEQWGNIAWADMTSAFNGASNLRVPATDAPDLSGVTDLESMFQSATSFNDPIEHWDVITIVSFFSMFNGASNFNQPLNNWTLNPASVDIRAMFRNTRYNQPLNDWNVSGAGSTFRMFSFNPDFNQPLDNWDVSNVIDMSEMFYEAQSFNQDIRSWDTSSVVNMNRLFRGAEAFNQDISTWDTSSVSTMNDMFRDATAFNQSLNAWDLSSTTSFFRMFSGATS